MRYPKGELIPDTYWHAWALKGAESGGGRPCNGDGHEKFYTRLVDQAIQQQQRGAPVGGFDDKAIARDCQDSPSLQFIRQQRVSYRTDNLLVFVFNHPADRPAWLTPNLQGIAQMEMDPFLVAFGREVIAGFKQGDLLIVLERGLAKLGTSPGFLLRFSRY